ncbi:MAG: hypothetical protein HQM12_19445 [SAR324 cluster bacterium]|nr:hypothetical protein [SAR324 cluster bacterium]MBF0350456.1 hypothetical protein [SAR324 cluster bacterium]
MSKPLPVHATKTLLNASHLQKSFNTSKDKLKFHVVQGESYSLLTMIKGVAEDIESLRKEIIEWSQRSVLDKAMSIFTKKTIRDRVIGEDILKFHPSKKVMALIEALKLNPMDYKARVDLVATLYQSEKNLTLEAARSLLVHISVAHSFGIFSMEGIDLTIWCQKLYLLKLQERWRKIFSRYDPLEFGQKANVLSPRDFNQITENLRLIKIFLEHTNRAVISPKCRFKGEFNVTDVRSFEKSMGKDTGQAQFCNHIHIISSLLRYQLFLKNTAIELLETAIKMDTDNPMGYYLLGKVHTCEMTFMIQQFRLGNANDNWRNSIKDQFKLANHNYGMALKISETQGLKTSVQPLMMIEYVSSLLYFIESSTRLLAIKLPRPWLAGNLNYCYSILFNSPSNLPKIRELIEKIDQWMLYYKIW